MQFFLIIEVKALFTAYTGAVLVSLNLSARRDINYFIFYTFIALPINIARYSTVLMDSMKTKALESSSM